MSLIETLAFHNGEEAYSTESFQKEREYELYLKGVDIDAIVSKSVSKEEQEQWGIFVPKTDKNAAQGTVRIRKTIFPDGRIEYVQAIKAKGGSGNNPEKESVSDETSFTMFKLLADQGLIKTRYHVPKVLSNGFEATLEFDVFKNQRGEIVPWVKVDVELPEGVSFSMADIDIEVDEVYLLPPDKSQVPKETMDKVFKIFETYFRTPNAYV